MTTRPIANAARAAHGMTLVELMVGLAVGLFVTLIAIAVFVSTRTLNTVSNSGSRMGENSRLAMDVLQDDLRSAGFQGCHSPTADPPVSVLNATAAWAAGFLDSGTSGVAGYRGTGAGFTPSLNAALAGLPPDHAPLADSDIVSVRVPADRLSFGLTETMASTSAAPQVGASGVNPGSTFRRGDIALIANCKGGTIFQITAADPAATGSLEHALGGPAPGNASTDLMQRYRGDAAVYRLQTRHYYVAPSALHPGTNALWRFTVPAPAGDANPQELAAGIDRLNVSWGVDTEGDQTVNRYVAADAVTDWEQVVSVRLQMLSATTKDGVAQTPQTVEFAGAPVTATDRRLRTVSTEVVTLRSRAP